MSHPTAFISYSWDDDDHRAWVKDINSASRIMNPSPTADSPRWRRHRLWVYCGIFFAAVARIVFLPAENPNDLTVNLTPVGEIQTNGEHWVLFRFDAPKSKAVTIQQILAISGDRMLLPTATRAEPVPDPNLLAQRRIKGGGSLMLKVRRIGGGDWQARVDFFVPLCFERQYLARIKESWREKSFKPWKRTYIEHGQRFVESIFVKTTETVVVPPPPAALPWSSATAPWAFFPFPITPDESGKTGEGRGR